MIREYDFTGAVIDINRLSMLSMLTQKGREKVPSFESFPYANGLDQH